MKTKHIIIGMVVLLVIYFTVLILSFILKKDDKIEKLIHLRFTYSTGYHINAFVVYEIDLIDGKYILKVKPTDLPDEDTKEIEISKDLVKKIETKLNEYNVINWNGFRKTNNMVLDGDSFSINIKYSGDKRVDASGYMMWPKNYREVKQFLDKELGSLYK